MDGILCSGHQLWKWKWAHPMLALLDWFLPNDHTVEVGILVADHIIQNLILKAAATSLSILFVLKAKGRAYRKVVAGYGFPA